MGEISELLPCPFCGGTAKLHHPKNIGADGGIMSDMGMVQCETLGCFGSIPQWSSTSRAIAAWNRRAETRQEPGEASIPGYTKTGEEIIHGVKVRSYQRDERVPAVTVTEEMVEAVVEAVRPYTRETLFIDEHRALVRTALEAAFAARPAEPVASDLVKRLNAAADGIDDVDFDRLSRRRGYKDILREAASALASITETGGAK